MQSALHGANVVNTHKYVKKHDRLFFRDTSENRITCNPYSGFKTVNLFNKMLLTKQPPKQGAYDTNVV